MSKIKEHFVNHKDLYAGLGVGLILGALAAVVYKCDSPEVVNTNQNNGIVIWKPQQTIEVHIEALGDPGNIIQEVSGGTAGQIWASQNQLARDLGVNPARISEHLTGKLDNIGGREFTKLGKAVVN